MRNCNNCPFVGLLNLFTNCGCNRCNRCNMTRNGCGCGCNNFDCDDYYAMQYGLCRRCNNCPCNRRNERRCCND